MKIFGREPATILAAVSALVYFVSAYLFELTSEQQGAINAAAVFSLGLVTAFMVAQEKILPAVTGFTQAVIALALSFGADLSQDEQAAAMGVVTALVGLFVRQQVTAKVGPKVPVNTAGAHGIQRQTGGSLTG